MQIVLTGATGFLGSHIAAELLARGHRVTCLVRGGGDRRRLLGAAPAATLISADLNDHVNLPRVMEQIPVDAVCHAAWQGVFNTDRDAPVQFDNVTATHALVSAALRAGALAIVGIGSQAEYGPVNRVADEDTPLNPTTLYGRAKCAAHDALRGLCAEAGVRCAWLRVFSLYGPGDSPGWLIPWLIGALLRGEEPALTAGEQMWDFLHVSDAARAVADVVECPTASGDFNLGSGTAYRLRTIVEQIRDEVAPGMELRFGQVPYREDQVMHLEADIRRLREAVGWAPRIPLQAGLSQTIAAFREQLR